MIILHGHCRDCDDCMDAHCPFQNGIDKMNDDDRDYYTMLQRELDRQGHLSGVPIAQRYIPAEELGDFDFDITNNEDMVMWPDSTWCFRHELNQFTHKSDDYYIIPFGSCEWHLVNNHSEDITP
jgi:hypothetical protein